VVRSGCVFVQRVGGVVRPVHGLLASVNALSGVEEVPFLLTGSLLHYPVVRVSLVVVPSVLRLPSVAAKTILVSALLKVSNSPGAARGKSVVLGMGMPPKE